MLSGIYSNDGDYLVDATTGQATFYIKTINNCCIDYIGSRIKDTELIPNAESFLNVFPNPNNGSQLMLHYQFKNKGQATIEIYNLLGKKIISKLATIKEATLDSYETIDLGNFAIPSGFYMVRITNGSEAISSKLLINK